VCGEVRRWRLLAVLCQRQRRNATVAGKDTRNDQPVYPQRMSRSRLIPTIIRSFEIEKLHATVPSPQGDFVQEENGL
jgi:hypothetical protein